MSRPHGDTRVGAAKSCNDFLEANWRTQVAMAIVPRSWADVGGHGMTRMLAPTSLAMHMSNHVQPVNDSGQWGKLFSEATGSLHCTYCTWAE